MRKITTMSFTLKMDRPLKNHSDVESPYYLSPGGYEVAGKPFDFQASVGDIDPDRLDVVHFDVEDLDEDYCEKGIPTYEDIISGNWGEFFIFTGEGNDPEIFVEKVESLTVHFDDGTAYEVPESALSKINDLLEDYNRLFEQEKE